MIHQYKMFNQNIVLDICSGSIHVVDEIAYDMIAEFLDKDKNALVSEMKEKYPSVETSELEECYDQILELKEKVDLGVGELETLQSVMNEIKAMNKEYASYSGAPEGATVTSRYVFRTKEESSK